MSKRLQVVLSDEELQRFEATANELGLTVSEWVRQALRAAEREVSLTASERKLSAIRAAILRSYPAPDIDQMNAEIEQGYAHPDPA
jgi:hypothetical protein